MVKKVTSYETTDGKVFKTKAEAEAWEAPQRFGVLIDELFSADATDGIRAFAFEIEHGNDPRLRNLASYLYRLANLCAQIKPDPDR